MKNIEISDSKKISSLQEEFHEIFPFLKLEFFHHKHNSFQGSYKKDILNPNITLKQCRKKHSEGVLLIKEDMKVTEIENLFQDTFGLSAQVFRKSGKSWIETTVTDDWTLKRQNDEGKELSFLSR
jgi:hypothetical protein